MTTMTTMSLMTGTGFLNSGPLTTIGMLLRMTATTLRLRLTVIALMIMTAMMLLHMTVETLFRMTAVTLIRMTALMIMLMIYHPIRLTYTIGHLAMVEMVVRIVMPTMLPGATPLSSMTTTL
ncbi:hypothetical protein GGH12_006290 [Coemansia sp. RSA 1822]|nr:hypothetical protein GGH12_006290 [Coemansia sp. RSA 1822]